MDLFYLPYQTFFFTQGNDDLKGMDKVTFTAASP